MVFIRQILRVRGLDQCSNGGLNSYGLFNMLVFHLKKTQELKYDLTESLFTFFQYYGDLNI